MQIQVNLTQKELNDCIKHYLGIMTDIEVIVNILPDVSQDEPEVIPDSEGWIMNNQEKPEHPYELPPQQRIQVVFEDGNMDVAGRAAGAYCQSWDTTCSGCIVKYRKI